MANENHEAYLVDVLHLFGEELDMHDSIFWRVSDDRKVRFLVNCNDQFWWACADCEEITPENLPRLRQAIAEVKAITTDDLQRTYPHEGLMLFVARERKMRPQGCCYPKDRALWPLFDAAGPERKKEFGNPYAPGEREELIAKKQAQDAGTAK